MQLVDPFNNEVKINTDSEYKNDCDENDIGIMRQFVHDEDITTSEDIRY